eukprot:m.349872 g.349872  ORF g.349872 m.349872 type:complete len:82 (+) comp16578_c0_seq16:2323-2568(+)
MLNCSRQQAGVNSLPTEGDVAQIIVREATAADGPAILGPCSKDVYNGDSWFFAKSVWHNRSGTRCGAQGMTTFRRTGLSGL